MKRAVEVLGYEYEIDMRQKSKSVWQAYGLYEGRTIRAEGRTESAAMTRWIKRAISKASE